MSNSDLYVVRLGDGVVPEDVRAHAVSPEARGDDAGLRHEGDEVVAGAEGHGVPVGEPPLPPVVRDQPRVPARAANRGLVRLPYNTAILYLIVRNMNAKRTVKIILINHVKFHFGSL